MTKFQETDKFEINISPTLPKDKKQQRGMRFGHVAIHKSLNYGGKFQLTHLPTGMGIVRTDDLDALIAVARDCGKIEGIGIGRPGDRASVPPETWREIVALLAAHYLLSPFAEIEHPAAIAAAGRKK